jgi:choice-of-anchor B domain-containing protein
MPTQRTCLALAILLPPAAAQAVHCTELSRLDTKVGYAGVWGYTAPDLREYAIVAERTGTWIVDCTDPRLPREVAYFSAPASTWREVTSLGPILYSVSEAHGGLRLIDMTDPANPVDLGLRHASASWTNTHTVSADPQTGRIYANGTNAGMRVLDARTDPRNPVLLSSWTTSYVHDSFWQNGKGYLAHITAGNVRIVDAGQAALPQLSLTNTPGRFTHNVWVSADDRLMLTTDENSSGFLQAWDVANPALPVLRGSYAIPGSIVHNAFGIGGVAYVSWYVSGLEVVDLADPANLKRVAAYDTSSLSGGFNGAWGAYPYSDSGVVYVSDMQNGLHCIQVDVGHLNRFGTGTRGSNGLPRMTTSGGAIELRQSSLRLELSHLPPNAPLVLVLSGAQGTGTVLGASVHVSPAGALFLRASSDANGRLSLPFPMPAHGYLALARIYAQIFAVEGNGLVSSRGMWFGIGPG